MKQFLILLMLLQSSLAYSQEGTRAYVDPNPLPSARGDALSGALSGTADDLDAARYNPAGIGGLDWGKAKVPFARKVYFPVQTFGTNEHAVNLTREFNERKGTESAALGDAILRAHEGKRQYARYNLMPALVLGRTLFVPINDLQVAATPDGEGGIDTVYQATSGFGAGLSIQTPDGGLSLGYFGRKTNQTLIQGLFQYQDIVNPETRSSTLNQGKSKVEKEHHSVGTIYTFGKNQIASFSLASLDFTEKESLTAGFALKPKIGKRHQLNWTMDALRLTERDLSLTKKLRTGLEWNLWGLGSYATLAFRVGASHAGGSFGTRFDLGLIGFDAAYTPTDIGVNNEKVIEKRGVGTVFVNVAEF